MNERSAVPAYVTHIFAGVSAGAFAGGLIGLCVFALNPPVFQWEMAVLAVAFYAVIIGAGAGGVGAFIRHNLITNLVWPAVLPIAALFGAAFAVLTMLVLVGFSDIPLLAEPEGPVFEFVVLEVIVGGAAGAVGFLVSSQGRTDKKA